jgi:uncharacterized protein YciI
MLVSLLCFDKPGHGGLRHLLRPYRLAWLESAGDRITFAGPLLSDDAKTAHGSIIIAEFASLDEAAMFSESDPYVVGELFEHVHFHLTRQVLPSGDVPFR